MLFLKYVDMKYVVFENIYFDFWPKEALKQRKNTYVLNEVFKNQVWAWGKYKMIVFDLKKKSAIHFLQKKL
jgi:hypothetical protein